MRMVPRLTHLYSTALALLVLHPLPSSLPASVDQPWWTRDLGPDVQLYRIVSTRASNLTVDQAIAAAAAAGNGIPEELPVRFSMSTQPNFAIKIDDQPVIIPIDRWDATIDPREVAERVIADRGVAAPSHIVDRFVEQIREWQHQEWYGEQQLHLDTTSNATPEDIERLAADLCRKVGSSVQGQEGIRRRSATECTREATEHTVRTWRAQRWRVACKLRGIEHSFNPPFFDHWHSFAPFRCTNVIFSQYLLGEGMRGDEISGLRTQQPLLDVRSPLRLLEVGSFEGGSATWLAQHVLAMHPGSMLLCVDNWSAENYVEKPNSVEERMTASLRNQTASGGDGVSGALARFRANLARTPGGDRVVAARAADSAVALSVLLGRAPTREGSLWGTFDFIYGEWFRRRKGLWHSAVLKLIDSLTHSLSLGLTMHSPSFGFG
jgi:hypothetical protein